MTAVFVGHEKIIGVDKDGKVVFGIGSRKDVKGVVVDALDEFEDVDADEA